LDSLLIPLVGFLCQLLGLQCFKLSKILVILIQLKLEVQLLFKLGSLDWLNN
jgi:hypothetical protein